MKKTLRLTENDLVRLVRKVIEEQKSKYYDYEQAEKILYPYFGVFNAGETAGSGVTTFAGPPDVHDYFQIDAQLPRGGYDNMNFWLDMYDFKDANQKKEIEKLFASTFASLGVKRSSQSNKLGVETNLKNAKKFLDLLLQFERVIFQKYKLKMER